MRKTRGSVRTVSAASRLDEPGRHEVRTEPRDLVRVVAADYLASVDTNRYSVPFTLIGQSVDVLRRAGTIEVFHQGQRFTTHPEAVGKHQLRILPEHGPGAIVRLTRERASTPRAAVNPLSATTPPVNCERSQLALN